MKIKCRQSQAEENAKITEAYSKKRYLSNWHRIFAFVPHCVDVVSGECRWLEFIQRKGTWTESYSGGEDFWVWEYQV